MPDYRVAWFIDVDASTPRDAAERARAAQTRPGTTAVVFEVAEVTGRFAGGMRIGEWQTIDLEAVA